MQTFWVSSISMQSLTNPPAASSVKHFPTPSLPTHFLLLPMPLLPSITQTSPYSPLSSLPSPSLSSSFKSPQRPLGQLHLSIPPRSPQHGLKPSLPSSSLVASESPRPYYTASIHPIHTLARASRKKKARTDSRTQPASSETNISSEIQHIRLSTL